MERGSEIGPAKSSGDFSRTSRGYFRGGIVFRQHREKARHNKKICEFAKPAIEPTADGPAEGLRALSGERARAAAPKANW
jgi:hypothetical protein